MDYEQERKKRIRILTEMLFLGYSSLLLMALSLFLIFTRIDDIFILFLSSIIFIFAMVSMQKTLINISRERAETKYSG